MRTLLLADDSVTTQRIVALTFAEESFRVVTVADGQQAIDAMRGMRPDIVLAGTTLPRINGYELAEYMRGHDTLRGVPVLLLAGAFESIDQARLKASGARGVFEKPLEPIAVISRVRELLGLKNNRPAAPTGRLVTSGETPADRTPAPRQAAPAPPPVHPAPVSSWDELRQESGLEPDARSVEGGTPGSGREDYLDTLDAAFDSLDQHLAGRQPKTNPQRNPSPPLGQAGGAPDPRSPGRRPPLATGGAANSVFEVDQDWFADDRKAGELAARSEMVADAIDAMPPREPAAPGNPIFEIDDEWFAENEKAREERRTHERELAAEMGIHDVELPEVLPSPDAPAPADGLDFDFGLEDIVPNALVVTPEPATDPPHAAQAVDPAPDPTPVAPAPPVVAPPPPAKPFVAAAPEVAPEPVSSAPLPAAAPVLAPAPPPDSVPAPLSTPAPLAFAQEQLAPLAPAAPLAAPAPLAFAQEHPAPLALAAPLAHSSVADDFAALLAFETGDAPLLQESEPELEPVPPAPGAAEITDAMLDQIAQRVAERLNSSGFGEHLRDALMSTVRDTVRSVVSDTSERLVREEIERIKSKNQI